MSILSENIESTIDVEVWYQQELLPIVKWHEGVWLNYVDPQQMLIDEMQEELANEINRRILERMAVAYAVKNPVMPGILTKNDYNGRQNLLLTDDRRFEVRNRWNPRAGP